MNDSIKQNRANLKGGKKPFSKDDPKYQYKLNDKEVLVDKVQLSDDDRIRLLRKIRDDNEKEGRRKLLLLGLSVGTTIAILLAFLYIWKTL